MRKAIKLILGLVVISAIGLMYGRYYDATNEDREEKLYSYISFEFPGGEIKSTQIKEIPKSRCQQIREAYYQASLEKCVGCKVLANDCRKDIPLEYSKAFNKENIGIPYIFKPYTFPEITFFVGLPKGAFSQLCTMEKENLSTTFCIE